MAAMDANYASFAGLDLLASAVLLIDEGRLIRYINPAGENLLAVSSRTVAGKTLDAVCTCSATLQSALDNGLNNNWGYTGQNIQLKRSDGEIRCALSWRPVSVCSSSCSRSSTTWRRRARNA